MILIYYPYSNRRGNSLVGEEASQTNTLTNIGPDDVAGSSNVLL